MPTPLPVWCPPHPFSANMWAAQAEVAEEPAAAACREVLSSQKATANAEIHPLQQPVLKALGISYH